MNYSLLDYISKDPNNAIVSDKWLNGQTGMIVDLKGDFVFRFIDYKNDNGEPRTKHTTEESKLSCPVVACGLIGYWLHNKDSDGIKKIFDSYYELRLEEYKKAHELDDYFEDNNLEEEFVNHLHFLSEKRKIKESETLFAFITESDQKTIKRIIKKYKKYVLTKRIELYKTKYPSNKYIEETFLKAYRNGGPAWECMEWLRTEHNLPYMGPHKNNCSKSLKECLPDELKKRHEKTIPERIATEFELFDFNAMLSEDGKLMDEIKNNIEKYDKQEDRVRYILSLLQPFKEFAEAFDYTAQIDIKIQNIQKNENRIKELEEMPDNAIDERTGEPICPKDKIAELSKIIEDDKKDIDYWKKVQAEFSQFADHGLNVGLSFFKIKVLTVNDKMCRYLGMWWLTMIYFSRSLAALGLTYGIDFMDVQKKSGVYLKSDFTIFDYKDRKFINSIEYAKNLLDEIEGNEQNNKHNNMTEPTQKTGTCISDNNNTTKEETTQIVGSDFEHIKDYQDNENLDYYLSENHWNFHVNFLLYKNLLKLHDDQELGAILYGNNNPAYSPINEYSELYGKLFNEAYRLCKDVLITPVPETKVAKFAKQAATWKFKNAKDENGNTINIVPNVTDLIESYHILCMAHAILIFANDQKGSIDRFLVSLSLYNDKGLDYYLYHHCFEPYIEHYKKIIFQTILSCANLRPGYNYKEKDEYLRNNIPWFRKMAIEYEQLINEVIQKDTTNINEQINNNCIQFFGPVINSTNNTQSPSSNNYDDGAKDKNININRTDCSFLYNNDEYFAIAIQEFTNKLRSHNLIPDDMDCKKMESLFSGRSCRTKYKWLGDNHILTHIIKGLTDGEKPIITTWPKGTSKWEVVSCRFVDKEGNALPNIRQEKARKKSVTIVNDAINALAGYL